MGKVNNYVSGVLLKNCIESYPFVYTKVQKFRYRNSMFRHKIVDNKTSLVIEGYPRSANSFSVKAFQYSQGDESYRFGNYSSDVEGSIKIGNHTHSFAQIIRGVQLSLPVVVLIRNPLDAINSKVANKAMGLEGGLDEFVRNYDINWSIDYYIMFYSRLLEYTENVVLGEFDVVTNNFGLIIDRLNQKYGLALKRFHHTVADQEEIFSQSKKHLYPSSERSKLKTEVGKLLDNPVAMKKLSLAEQVYSEFCERF